MYKILLSALLVLTTQIALAAESSFEAQVTQGYKKEHLSWSISGPHGKPNILSELKYKHIKVYTTGLMFNATSEDFFAKLRLSYGNVYSGRCTDSDYASSNKKNLFSKSHMKIPGSYTFDTNLTIGKSFHYSQVTLSPQAGYMFSQQKLRMKHGVATVWPNKWLQSVQHGHHKIHGLNSTYKARWDGPFIGINGKWNIHKKISLFAEYNYLFLVQYHGTGFWNLRQKTDIQGNFHQHSKRHKGNGHMAAVGANARLTERLGLSALVQSVYMNAKGGKDTIHIRNKGKKHLPFHKAHLGSMEYSLGLNWQF